MDIAKYRNAFKINDFYTHMGKIDKIVGMTVEATGPNCNIGDVCKITIGYPDKTVLAEVVGFKENKVLLMPYQDTEGIGYGSSVTNTGEKLMIHCSDELWMLWESLLTAALP